MDKARIPFLSATELARLIRVKEVSPVEATEAYLDRIEALDSSLNSYLTVCRDSALESAREAEGAILRGDHVGPMHGVPVAVKDQLYTRGVCTTGGSPIFNDFVPDHDATVVARLKAAGAILLGKLNMTEFATTGFSHRFSMPRNPWDLDRYTGGSSSGAGAATGGFLCATSLGEDTGGSIRFPAAWCGLVGLRPSWGRVSRHGLMPGVWSMDTVGPISRTVEDCAMTLQAIAGYDPLNPHTWNVPVPDYGKGLKGDMRGVRVGVLKEMLDSKVVDEEVRGEVSRAISTMTEMGALVEEVSIPLSARHWPIMSGLRIDAPVNYRALVRDRIEEIGHSNRIGFLLGSILPAQAHYKALKLRAMLRRQVLETLDRVDVLVTPTSGIVAQEVDMDTSADPRKAHTPWLLTPIFSLAGTPALTICCGFTSERLPVGLQIAGKPFDEATVLRVAHAYEQGTPWHTMIPTAV